VPGMDSVDPYEFTINRPLTILGEDSKTTIIDGKGLWGIKAIVTIFSNDVILRGFTIRNGMRAILAEGENVTISDCLIEDVNEGVFLSMASKILIESNMITTNRGIGICFGDNTGDITIEENTILNCDIGIRGTAGPTAIRNNVIRSNREAIFIGYSYTYEVCANLIDNNDIGISLLNAGNRTVIYSNNFISNKKHVDSVVDYSQYIKSHRYPRFDNGTVGNFWSDYVGEDQDGNGVGETRYVIYTYHELQEITDAMNKDNCPLIFPVVWDYVNPVPIVWKRELYLLGISGNSTISTFRFSQLQKQISFFVTGPSGTLGCYNTTIPIALLSGNPWTMTIDDAPKTDFIKTENGTHTFIYFSGTHASTSQVIIQGTSAIPEFPSTMILPLFVVISMLAAAFAKYLRWKKPR
jgi:parallel beta-helix repeat protein